MSVPNVLSIAGTDPTGGAGVQADLKSIAANGGYGMSVVTALVAQNTQGVRAVHYPPVDFLRSQLEAVSDDVRIDAVKIGMLGTAEVIAVVREWLQRIRPAAVVLDPVMVATSGDRLLDAAAEAALRDLCPLADVLTPNVPELAVLAGAEPADNEQALLEQARRVAADTGALVIAKGGHLSGPSVTDILVGARGALDRVEHPRIDTRNTHGTGCSLSSALATRHAVTGDWATALRQASGWLSAALVDAEMLDVGRGHGPVHHLGPLWRRAGGAVPDRPTGWWWQSVSDVRAAIATDAFVTGLGDGTLDADAFGWYLAQDALYLAAFARSLAAAAELASDPEERAFWRASSTEAIDTELMLHRSWVPEDVRAATRPSPTTAAYVDHLVAAEQSADYAVLTAALLPCFWIYSDVGLDLAARNHAGHPYADWLATYGDESFTAATRQAVAMTDAAVGRADRRSRESAERAFRTSCELELAFFQAPLRRDQVAPAETGSRRPVDDSPARVLRWRAEVVAVAVWIGTSGWTYADWSGPFYPAQVKARDRLQFYAARFDTVGLNASHYHWPKDTQFASWRDRLPEGFVMTVKAPRVFTHAAGLRPAEGWADRINAGLSALGQRCGPLLLQFPPRLVRDDDALRRLLDSLGEPSPNTHRRRAVEFRHPSWRNPDTLALLAERQVAIVQLDRLDPRRAGDAFGYVRMHGPDPRRPYHGSYAPQQLELLARGIGEYQAAGSDVYVYFNNDIGGHAVADAATLRTLLP